MLPVRTLSNHILGFKLLFKYGTILLKGVLPNGAGFNYPIQKLQVRWQPHFRDALNGDKASLIQIRTNVLIFLLLAILKCGDESTCNFQGFHVRGAYICLLCRSTSC